MNHELPEDISKWPYSSWELLGLERTASNADIRKAYARLIRIYRPDTHPEAFQRIHQAYQSLKNTAAQGESSAQLELPNTKQAERRTEISTDSPDVIGKVLAEAASFEADTIELFSGQGEFSAREAWTLLSQRFDKQPAAEVAAARYWLLVLDPTLDESSCPLEILCDAICLCGDAVPLGSLLLQEMEISTAEEWLAIQNLDRLLRVLPAWRGGRVFLARWQTFANAGLHKEIADDVEYYRDKCLKGDHGFWVNTMVSLLGILAGAETETAQTLATVCRNDIADFANVRNTSGADLLRFDHVDEILKARRETQDTTPDELCAVIRSIVPELWCPGAKRTEVLTTLSRKLTEEQPSSLAALDSAAQRCRAELNYIYVVLEEELLGRRSYQADTAHMEERIHQYYRFLRARTPDYRSMRNKFLRFCVDEFVYPSHVAEVLESEPSSPTLKFDDEERHASTALQEDIVLRVLVRAKLYLLS